MDEISQLIADMAVLKTRQQTLEDDVSECTVRVLKDVEGIKRSLDASVTSINGVTKNLETSVNNLRIENAKREGLMENKISKKQIVIMGAMIVFLLGLSGTLAKTLYDDVIKTNKHAHEKQS